MLLRNNMWRECTLNSSSYASALLIVLSPACRGGAAAGIGAGAQFGAGAGVQQRAGGAASLGAGQAAGFHAGAGAEQHVEGGAGVSGRQ